MLREQVRRLLIEQRALGRSASPEALDATIPTAIDQDAAKTLAPAGTPEPTP